MSRSLHRAAAVVAVCLALSSCSKQPAAQRAREPLCRGCNVVLVSMDTVRSDHLGVYGYWRPTSPNVDRLASRAVVFDNAVSQSAWTLPAHGSMMTGLYPGRLGVTGYPATRRLPTEASMLAEEFKRAGYATAGFTGGGFVSAHFGFARGFDTYVSDGRRFEHNLDEALGWLRANGERRFFLFLHGYDAHRPYYTPAADKAALGLRNSGKDERKGYCTRQNRARPIDLDALIGYYDAAIHSADRQVGRVLDALEHDGLMDKTVVVITSDHGEEFFEHGNCDHVRTLYREVVAVPYILYVPGLTGDGLHIDDLVPASISVARTLLDLAGIDHDMPGASLEPMLHGKRDMFGAVYSETDSIIGNMGSRGEAIAITTERYKLISYTEEGRDEAFDRINDPDERDVLDESSPAYLARTTLRAWHDSLKPLPRPYAEPPAASGRRRETTEAAAGTGKRRAAATATTTSNDLAPPKQAGPATRPRPPELPDELREDLRSLGYLD